MNLDEEERLEVWFDLYSEIYDLDDDDKLSIIESLTPPGTRVRLTDEYMETAIESYANATDPGLNREDRADWIELYRDLMKELGWDEYDAHNWIDDLVSPNGQSH